MCVCVGGDVYCGAAQLFRVNHGYGSLGVDLEIIKNHIFDSLENIGRHSD